MHPLGLTLRPTPFIYRVIHLLIVLPSGDSDGSHDTVSSRRSLVSSSLTATVIKLEIGWQFTPRLKTRQFSLF